MNGAPDARIRSRATDVACHADADLLVCWLRPFAEQHSSGHDLSGLTIPALRHILRDPRLLQRTSELWRKPLDAHDLLAGRARYRRHTRAHRFAVEMHRARATQRHAEAEFCAGELKIFPEHPEQWRVRADIHRALLPVDLQSYHSCFLSSQEAAAVIFGSMVILKLPLGNATFCRGRDRSELAVAADRVGKAGNDLSSLPNVAGKLCIFLLNVVFSC